MSTIRLATATNVRAFQTLTNAITTTESSHTLDHEALQDEIGRFRVWCGNIGALQKGHSSLDYRLRDSPLLSSNVLKLLAELSENITAASDIISGIRLPYEKQQKPDESDEEENDDFFSDDEEEDELGAPKTELEMRFREIVDIIDNLYKLSVRIRQPTIRSRSLKAASYAPKDPDTKVDVLEQYSNFDLQHTQELVRHLRMPYVNSGDAQEDDALVNRLARAVTLRRRQFKYWKRHRDKLGISTILEDAPAKPQDARPDTINRHNTLEVQVSTPEQTTLKDATSEKTGRMTLLSGTEATHHHQSLDDIVDSKSVTSYATTVRDASGRSLQLPPPPKAADGEKDFECSICYTICPSRYANQRSWQVHVLQDLQPYVCTYPECDIPDQLFQRRRHWVEHEAGHRKAWRCPEHPDAVYKTAAGLRGHLLQRHGDSFPGSQLDSIVKVGETSTVDLRNCPICYAPSDSKEIANHIANHLERIAIFALPTTMHDHSEGASSRASRGTDNTYSQDLSGVSFNSDRSDAPSKSIIHDTVEEATSPMDTETLSASASGNREPPAELGLSAELLNRLPNAIQERLDILFAHQPSGSGDVSRPDDEDNEPEKLTSSADEESLSDLSVSVFYEAIKSKDRPSVLTASELPTLRKLYLSKLLTPRAETYAPDDRHNQIISFYNHDITRLKMDAIVNSANCSLGASNPSSSLNHIIHKAAGPDMARECKAHPRIKVGQATITAGYNLPCTHVIHTARPNYRGNRLPRRLEELAECYRSVLELAMNHNLRTIAFPAVGSGGCGFPPRVAARIALTTVREFLDSHPSHSFQMIAFCVFSGIDEEAYTNSLPVYFPPTQGDLESATPNKPGASITVLRAQVLDACIQTEAVLQKLGNFRRHVAAFPGAVLEHLTKIMHALRSLRTALLNNNQGIFLGTTKQSKTLDERTIEHVILICTAMKTVAGSITEITEVAKGKAALSQQNHQAIWDDYNEYMRTSQGLNVVGLLELCQDFAQCLEDVIVRDGDVPHEMTTMSMRLGSWLTKVTGRGEQGVRNLFDEVMYTRDFERDAPISSRTDIIPLYRVPSISRLYEMGELKQKPTFSTSSARFNDIVCLLRSDITQVEVDVIVNSTDPGFSGLGNLDRTIFKKAGPGMEKEYSQFEVRNEGEVVLTGAYELPAKHVLHAIPPEMYRTDSKNMLRRIYRDILHKTVSLNATSIAIPAIAAGELNWPRRECATLAIEQVKRFLESMESSSLIEKIIFCVFSSEDESIYKSLLPVYFPPVNNKALSTSGMHLLESKDMRDSPRRSQFGSIGEAFRNVTLGKQPVDHSKRSLLWEEETALDLFERHAETCVVCGEINKVYLQGGTLCQNGYAAAQNILHYLYMEADRTVFSTNLINNKRVQVELPAIFPLGSELLATVEKGFRDGKYSEPFVSPSRSWPGFSGYQKISGADGSEKAIAYVCIWSLELDSWQPVQRHESSIHVLPGELRIFTTEEQMQTQALIMSLLLLPTGSIAKRKSSSSEIIVVGFRTSDGVLPTRIKILLRCRSSAGCEWLFRKLRNASKSVEAYQSTPEDSVPQASSSTTQVLEKQKEEGESSNPRDASPPPSSVFTVPNDMWVCGVCNQGSDLTDARCLICGHERDATDFGPGQQFPETARDDLSVLASRVLFHLRHQLVGGGAHVDQLIKGFNVSRATITDVLVELQKKDLIKLIPGSSAVWRAADVSPGSVSERTGTVQPAVSPQPTYGDSRDTEQEEEEHQDFKPSSTLSPRIPPTPEVSDLLTSLENLAQAPSPAKPRPNTPTSRPSSPIPAIINFPEINVDDYFTYVDMPDLSATWTLIDRRVVSPKAVAEIREEYQLESEESLFVKRKLDSEEVSRLAERTVEIRSWRADWKTLEQQRVSNSSESGPSSTVPAPAQPYRPHHILFPGLLDPDHYTYVSMPELPEKVYTKIDRRIVGARAVQEAKLEFVESDDKNIVVRKNLTIGEIEELVVKTRRIRHGESRGWGVYTSVMGDLEKVKENETEQGRRTIQ